MPNSEVHSITVADKDVIEMIGLIEKDIANNIVETTRTNLERLLSARSVYEDFHQYNKGTEERDNDAGRMLKEAFTERTSLAISLAKQPDTCPDNINQFWLKAHDWLFPDKPPKAPKVFISHKKDHEEKVREFAKILDSCFGGNSRIVLAEDFKKGDSWRDKLRQEITSCHWFVFFLPDRENERDWLMSEAGIFEGTQTPIDQMIWISDGDPDDVPQYSHVQKCRYDAKDLCKLFTILFTESPIEGSKIPAINDNFNADLVIEPLNSLLDKFPPETSKEFTQVSTFDIVLDEGTKESKRCTVEDLKDMRVENVSPKALQNIFKIDADYNQFGKLVRRINDESRGNYWINELAMAIEEALAGNITSNIEASFANVDKQKIYHAFVYSVFRDVSGEESALTRVRVAISPGISATYGANREVDALMAALRYSYRLRFQVIERFRGAIDERAIGEIARILGQMEGESAFQGGMKEKELAMCFHTEEEKSKVNELFAELRVLRNPTSKDNPGKIDIAISERDGKMMEEALKMAVDMSKKFSQLGLNRMVQYADEKW